MVSYEEVVRLPAFKRKTLVLIGRSCVLWDPGRGPYRAGAVWPFVSSGERFSFLEQAASGLTSPWHCACSGICAELLGLG